MKRLLRTILEYMNFLEKHYGLWISFHFSAAYAMWPYSSMYEEYFRFTNHINPYCLQIKTSTTLSNHCQRIQRCIIRKCATTTSFVGVCHADVREYIRGLYHAGKPVGFISVSSYAAPEERFEKTPAQQELYRRSMTVEMPDTAFLDQLTAPLAVMFEYLLEKRFAAGKDTAIIAAQDSYYKILQYVTEHYRTVTLSELCEVFSYSKSYISHMFRQRCGTTLKGCCNALKVADAKKLLENTSMSVTEIGLLSGFEDLSYFIKTFKSIAGVTPLAWRTHKKPSKWTQ